MSFKNQGWFRGRRKLVGDTIWPRWTAKEPWQGALPFWQSAWPSFNSLLCQAVPSYIWEVRGWEGLTLWSPIGRALPYRSGRMQVSLCLALTRPNAFGCPYGRKDCYCLPQCQQLHFRAFFRPGSMLGALVSVLIRACISVSFSMTAHWGRPYFPLTEEQTGSRG